MGKHPANELRRRHPCCGEAWYLDEVFLTIRGERHYLWRAVGQHGHVLNILVRSRRNKKAAQRFFRKLLKGLQYIPRVIITDKLKSYGASAAQRIEQPGGEFAPTHKIAREENAAVHISKTSTTLSLCFRPHL